MIKIITLLLLLICAAGGYYYVEAYPPSVFKRATQYALDDLSRTVASHDRVKIGGVLTTLLSDSAKITLEVNFFSPLKGTAPAPMAEEFNKTQFLAFVDNILFSLSNYSYAAQVKTLVLSPDKHTADITFISAEEADDVSNANGASIRTGFSSDTQCSGHVTFADGHVVLDKANCKMLLRTGLK